MASPQHERGPPKRLLSLDGGGVKGISSLLILQAIMSKVQELEIQSATVDQTRPGSSVTNTERTAKLKELKPRDYFDLTGGTSTGGIIATMLSRLGMTCGEAIDEYRSLSQEVFAVRLFGINFSKNWILRIFGPLILDIKLLFGSQFGSKHLDDAIDSILSKYLPDPPKEEPKLVAERYNPHDAKGKMLMCATMADLGHALLFRDYTPPPDSIHSDIEEVQAEQQEYFFANPYDTDATAVSTNDRVGKIIDHLHEFDYNSVTIKEAVRATSAAPTYLPPMIIQKILFWDGGMLNNNPIDEVWAARYDLASTCHTTPYVSTVLSIGATWNTRSKSHPTGIIARLFNTLTKSIDFATNTEAKHLDFQRDMYRRNLRQRPDQQTLYFRFNAPVGDTIVGLADFRKIRFLERKTREFLALDDTKDQIEKCARLLLGQPVTQT